MFCSKFKKKLPKQSSFSLKISLVQVKNSIHDLYIRIFAKETSKPKVHFCAISPEKKS